jgi:hypothetical protein
MLVLELLHTQFQYKVCLTYILVKKQSHSSIQVKFPLRISMYSWKITVKCMISGKFHIFHIDVKFFFLP